MGLRLGGRIFPGVRVTWNVGGGRRRPQRAPKEQYVSPRQDIVTVEEQEELAAMGHLPLIIGGYAAPGGWKYQRALKKIRFQAATRAQAERARLAAENRANRKAWP